MIIKVKSSHHATASRRIITLTLTSLFGVIVAQAILNWFSTSMVLCRQGDSRLTIFIATATNGSLPMAVTISMNLLQNASLLLADGLMVGFVYFFLFLLMQTSLFRMNQVWRCFNACGRSIVGFALPMGFFVCEIGEYINWFTEIIKK